MMVAILASLIGMVLVTSAHAEVVPHLLNSIQKEILKDCTTCRAEVHLLNAEQKVEISDAHKVLAHNWRGNTKITIIDGGKVLEVPMEIRWMDQVLIADVNIKQGDVVDADKVKVVEKDVTFFNKAYLRESQKVLGMVAKRVFTRGQVIEEDLLKKANVVRYGQPLKVEFSEKTLTLTMSGQAKGAGAVGDVIPVFILNTKTNLLARIVDANNVRVE